MAMLAHILGIFTGFIGALIIWMVKKDDSAFVAANAKEALNFQLTILIGYVVSGALICVWIGIILWPIVYLASLIFSIIGGMAANKGESYRYPVCIRFIK